MKAGIICAGDKEAAPFFSMLRGNQVTEKAMLQFHQGYIGNVPVVVLFSGVCKVNAAIAAQILIDLYSCGAIINAGTAGGMNSQLQLFDTIVCTETAYHDVAENILTKFHPWLESVYFKADQRLLRLAEKAAQTMAPEYRIWFGRMVTGEKFIENDQRDQINCKYKPLCVDMETASIAHVCYVNRKPFISVRTITDTADHGSAAAFEENCMKASERSAEFVKKMLLMNEWSEEDDI